MRLAGPHTSKFLQVLAPTVSSKQCDRCLVEKAPSEFVADKYSQDGLKKRCKLCMVRLLRIGWGFKGSGVGPSAGVCVPHWDKASRAGSLDVDEFRGAYAANMDAGNLSNKLRAD